MLTSRRTWVVALSALLQSVLVQASPWAPWATAINRAGWTVTADSTQSGYPATNVLDNNNNSFWQSEYTPQVSRLPHTLDIDMKRSYVVNGVSYLPRQDRSSHGNVGQHTWQLSNDGNVFTTVAYGTYLNDATQKTTYFTNTSARYVRLKVTSEAEGNNNPWTSAAEIKVYSPNPNMPGSSFTPPPRASYGQWDVTVDMPVVPAAGAVTYSGRLVFWSAYRPDLFTGTFTGQTDTCIWDPPSQIVTQRLVTDTHHDMFCPGTSMDTNGRIVVSGGSSDNRTSILDPASMAWVAGADMNIGRGYQSQVTIADGRIFVIGGSYSGGRGGKNGEIYDPNTNIWSLRSGCQVAPMLTNDRQGVFRADNHGWLFAWRSNSIFQAGPSSAMNWYNVSGRDGSYVGAGNRASDPDAMTGNAVMYDAVAGKIFTIGGSHNYQDAFGTSNAHIITLGTPGSKPAVQTLPNAAFPRVYANSMVLPDGTVLTVGGQAYGLLFTDTTPQFIPELFDPSTRTYRQMAPIAVPRNYHSIGLLLPDARVLSAGGGLCGTGCQQNHFNAQIFSPPYLFTASGGTVRRPAITSVSPTSGRAGMQLVVTTNAAVAKFSLIRLGTATHTVDTDQRRIALTATQTGNNAYKMVVPSDPGIAVTGYWMLFAMNAAGVPSVAKIIHIIL